MVDVARERGYANSPRARGLGGGGGSPTSRGTPVAGEEGFPVGNEGEEGGVVVGGEDGREQGVGDEEEQTGKKSPMAQEEYEHYQSQQKLLEQQSALLQVREGREGSLDPPPSQRPPKHHPPTHPPTHPPAPSPLPCLHCRSSRIC